MVTGRWREMYDQYDQSRWAYLFYTGLIDEDEAERWADEVWNDGDEEDVDEEEEDDSN